MPRDSLPPPDPFLIRHARREDGAVLVRFLRRLASHHGDAGTLALYDAEWDVLGGDPWATALIAEADLDPIGCAVFGRHYRAPFAERCLDLGSLFVEPAWRGRGVGRALVEAVLRHAETLACSRVRVGTPSENRHAQRFYEKLGFEPAPARGPRYQALLSPVLRPA